jgi:hypothetical protein
VYRYRHNERLQPIVDCLGIDRIIGHALRLLMLKTGGEDQASFSHDIFLYVHQLDDHAEKFIADKLSTLRAVVNTEQLDWLEFSSWKPRTSARGDVGGLFQF